jgi:hypothetical protein
MCTRTLVGEGEAMGVDWVWQVSKYIIQLSPRDPCRAVIWYRGFEACAVHNVMTSKETGWSQGTPRRGTLRKLAQEGYLIREGRGQLVAFRPSPKLCEYVREHLEELRLRALGRP